jgi:hypothetical protein
MRFWEFLICTYCALACGDLSRAIVARPLLYLPMRPIGRNAFFVTTAPAMLGILVLPIYGFVKLPWWQPLLALLLGSILNVWINRPLLMGSPSMALWAMLFSLIGTSMFVFSI